MIKKSLIAATALTMATFATAPAQADGFYFGFYGNNGGFGIQRDHRGHRFQQQRHVNRTLSRKQIRRTLRNRGFHDFRRVEKRGHRYIVVAENRRGRLIRLRVNAYTGNIERRRRIH